MPTAAAALRSHRPRGTFPKPIEERRRIGNPSGARLPDPIATVSAVNVKHVPEPMRPLGIPGREMWERVWRAGAVWLATGIDAETLLVVCEQADERAQLRLSVLRDGDWRQRGALRALDSQIIGTLGLLGFNPCDRARLGATVEVESPLDAYMARRQQRSS